MLIEKTLRLLEYGEIMERAASRAVSGEAAEMIRGEQPVCDPGSAVQMKEAVQAILARIKSGDNEPRSSLPETGFLLPKLAVEGMSLEIDEAYAIGIFIERGGAIKKWLAPASLPLPETALAVLLEELPDCGAAAAEIFRVLDKDGKMRDLPGLRGIRQRIRSLNAELEAAVSRYAASEESRRMLQSSLPSQRDGRTVLAVKANFRGRIRGIVHEVSSTGQTIFVEPEEVVEKNNEILIEKRNLDAEIQRIMRDLTKKLYQYHEQLQIFHKTVLKIEVLRAKARYSCDTKGIFVANAVNSDNNINNESLILKQARHPLIADAVPIDFEMDGGIRTLIVTGPNTGGKTVALKTAGLFALMNQSGLALPCAEGTVLPLFDGIYADIGDEQSIGQSLSTFSAHITNIAGIIAGATERSLVLFDELGSGTDPEEGSAIAMAVLDYLMEKRSRLVITTHHGILKNYGYMRQGVENASVEFDVRTLSPTYRIITGIPGESRALDIAERNGLPPDIVAKARGYLNDERSDVPALISGLKEKHRELNEAAKKTAAEENRLREDRRRADLKELRLRQKELELKSGAAGKLRSLLDESRKTLENLVREVREGELNRAKTLKVKEFLDDLARTVEEESAALGEEERAIAAFRRRVESAAADISPNSGTAAFAPGMEVCAGQYRRRGTILRLDKKGPDGNIWLIETGSLKIRFSENDLIPAAPSKTELKPLIAAADLADSGGPGFEINLRGMRLEEALAALRRQIDAAVLSGLKEFSVVHGTGGGILQKGVHDYLRNEGAVADYYFSRPELGGFGRTEVILK
ncbi:MAG: Smr/MutS family protein [Treponema sp.]|jgi:DNA mismatch repair protein MutS2|nr:Smr/MutS family protein [Treponema sp.]